MSLEESLNGSVTLAWIVSALRRIVTKQKRAEVARSQIVDTVDIIAVGNVAAPVATVVNQYLYIVFVAKIRQYKISSSTPASHPHDMEKEDPECRVDTTITARHARVSKFKADAVNVVWKEIRRIEDERDNMVRETARLAMNHVMGGSTLAELVQALRHLTGIEREEVIRTLE
jgi:hypothetical protein